MIMSPRAINYILANEVKACMFFPLYTKAGFEKRHIQSERVVSWYLLVNLYKHFPPMLLRPQDIAIA